MKMIKKLVNAINEELESAEEYAENYIEDKANGRDSNFKEMAMDELRHADYIHSIAVEKINNLNGIITPPLEMQQKWDEKHAHYIEKVAEIKRILAM